MKELKDQDKEYTEGISIPKGRFLRWLDNYWYHYKWVTIAVAFFVTVFAVCALQMCSQEKEDLVVVYAGRNTLSVDEQNNVSRVLEAIAPRDFDGNGEVLISLNAFGILSQEQVEEKRAETGEDGKPLYVDNSYNSNQFDTYSNYIMTGESSVLFLDPWLYENLVAAGRLKSLEESLGYVPESACGEYGVRLGDTQLYSSYSVMRLLHEDTVICLLKPYVAGNSSKEDYYQRELDMFKAIVAYGENG